jgi:hypothetical protein
MKSIEPTVKDIRRYLEILGYDAQLEDTIIYNDRRGKKESWEVGSTRRIKISTFISLSAFEDLADLIANDFPDHEVAIGHHLHNYRMGWSNQTVIHFRRARETPKPVKSMELTMDDIAAKFGVPVSALKIVKKD